MCVCVCVRVYVYMSKPVYVCKCMCIWVCMCICVYVYIMHIYIYIYTCVSVCVIVVAVGSCSAPSASWIEPCAQIWWVWVVTGFSTFVSCLFLYRSRRKLWKEWATLPCPQNVQYALLNSIQFASNNQCFYLVLLRFDLRNHTQRSLSFYSLNKTKIPVWG